MSQAMSKKRALALITSCSAVLVTVLLAHHRDKRKKTKTRGPQPRLLRAAILRPVRSTHTTPWKQLLTFGHAGDFIVSINFPKDLVLHRMLPLFEEERLQLNYGSPYRAGPKTKGRQPTMESIDLLGIALWYLKSGSAQYRTCFIFGLVPTSLSVWLDYALEVLFRVVRCKKRAEFEVRWPKEDEMRASALLLQNNRVHGKLLEGIFAVTDGGRFKCADYTDPDLQNAYFEGYTQNVEVTNLFVWNFKGEIIHAAVNYPGSWHDNRLASASGLIFPKLSDECTPPGYAVLGDSAFAASTKVTNGKIVRGRKTNENNGIPESVTMAIIDELLQKIMPSERQSAEWGVRALKGPFARLKTVLTGDAYKRMRLILICVHLFNFRTRVVGLNQIRTTYADKNDQVQPWLKPFIENDELEIKN